MTEYDRALVWFRRDLRDTDHAALYHALKRVRQVYCVFVFDREILDAFCRSRHATGTGAGLVQVGGIGAQD